MDFPIATTLSVVAASVSALAAAGSWRSSQHANEAAQRANDTADALARIEHNRWHAELTPKLDVKFTDQGNDRALLKVTLSGPPGLDRLDELSVSVRDDGFNYSSTTHMSAAEADEATRVIWGPYRFIFGVDGGSEDRRSVAPVQLAQGDWALFGMDRTSAPSWFTTPDNWRQKYYGAPVRLTFTCTREGYQPWTIPWEGIVTAS